MKRIVILIDGTWDQEGVGEPTNVAKLDPANVGAGAPLLKTTNAAMEQRVVYHKGVGAEPDVIKHWLGGSIGLGLKQIVLDAYSSLVDLYEQGDDVFALGFSRGAYAARALVGLIGASGIVRRPDPAKLEVAWANYRVAPAKRAAPEKASGADKEAMQDLRLMRDAGETHADNRVKCVGVWDTVGSYGVPAGFGLAPLARYIALLSLGFHDTSFGDHVEFGLHAVAIDERRRPFVPTFWTIRRGQSPKGRVEQTWFAGDHGNIGGGEADARLSDVALVWMMARLQALTGLEFDTEAARAVAARASVDGEVYDSTLGWPIDHAWPHLRRVLSPAAVMHGLFLNRTDDAFEHINERVHWSVLKKKGRPGRVFGVDDVPYGPPNLPGDIPADRVAAITPEEGDLYERRGQIGGVDR